MQDRSDKVVTTAPFESGSRLLPRAARIARWLLLLPGLVLIGIVRLYQLLLSPVFGRQCRFYPTCSEYFILSVKKYGAFSGTVRGIGRLLRCHPFHPGGYDPP